MTRTFMIVDYMLPGFNSCLRDKHLTVQRFNKGDFTRIEVSAPTTLINRVQKNWDKYKSNNERISSYDASTHASLTDKILFNKLKNM